MMVLQRRSLLLGSLALLAACGSDDGKPTVLGVAKHDALCVNINLSQLILS